MPSGNDHEICCSFCGKPQSVADRLIAGSGVYICDACVRLCMSIIEEACEEARFRQEKGRFRRR